MTNIVLYKIFEIANAIKPESFKKNETSYNKNNLIQYIFKNEEEYRVYFLEKKLTTGNFINQNITFVSFSLSKNEFVDEYDYNMLTKYNHPIKIISNVFWCIENYISLKKPKFISVHSDNRKLNNIYLYFIEKNGYIFLQDVYLKDLKTNLILL